MAILLLNKVICKICILKQGRKIFHRGLKTSVNEYLHFYVFTFMHLHFHEPCVGSTLLKAFRDSKLGCTQPAGNISTFLSPHMDSRLFGKNLSAISKTCHSYSSRPTIEPLAADKRLSTVSSPYMVSVKFLLKKSNAILTNSIDGLGKILVETALIYFVLTIYLNNKDKMYTDAILSLPQACF